MQKETIKSDYDNSISAKSKPFLQLFRYSKICKCILSSFAHPSKLLQQPIYGIRKKKKAKTIRISYEECAYFMISFQLCTKHLTYTLTCLSLAGFQSGSNKTSRFPPIKLRPQPPALLLKRNTNSSCKKLSVYLFIEICRPKQSIEKHKETTRAYIACIITNVIAIYL